jgi:hypothetical protein
MKARRKQSGSAGFVGQKREKKMPAFNIQKMASSSYFFVQFGASL